MTALQQRIESLEASLQWKSNLVEQLSQELASPGRSGEQMRDHGNTGFTNVDPVENVGSSSIQDHPGLQHGVNDLEALLAERSVELERLRSQLSQSESDRKEHEIQNLELQRHTKELFTRCLRLEETLGEERLLSGILSSQVKSLEENLWSGMLSVEEAVSARTVSLTERLSVMEGGVIAVQGKLRILKNVLQKKEAELHSCKGATRQREELCEELRAEVEELSALLVDKSEQISELEQELDKLTEAGVNHQDQDGTAREEMRESRSLLEAQSSQLESLEKQLLEKSAESVRLRSEFADVQRELENKVAELNMILPLVRGLQIQNVEMNASVAELTDSLLDKSLLVADLESQLQELNLSKPDPSKRISDTAPNNDDPQLALDPDGATEDGSLQQRNGDTFLTLTPGDQPGGDPENQVELKSTSLKEDCEQVAMVTKLEQEFVAVTAQPLAEGTGDNIGSPGNSRGTGEGVKIRMEPEVAGVAKIDKFTGETNNDTSVAEHYSLLAFEPGDVQFRVEKLERELGMKVSELEKSVSSIHSLETENRYLTASLNDLTESLVEKSEMVAELESQLDQISLCHTAGRLTGQDDSTEIEYNTEKESTSTEQLRLTITEQSEQLVAMETEMVACQSQILDLQKVIEGQRQEIISAKQSESTIMDQLAEKTLRINSLEVDLSSQRKENDRLLQENKTQIEMLTKEKSSYTYVNNDQIQELMDMLLDRAAQLESLEVDLQEAKGEIVRISRLKEMELKTANKALEDAKSRLEQLEAELESQHHRKSPDNCEWEMKWASRVEELQKEVEHHTQRAVDLEEARRQLQQKYQDLLESCRTGSCMEKIQTDSDACETLPTCDKQDMMAADNVSQGWVNTIA